MTLIQFLTKQKNYKKIKLSKISTQHLTLSAKINKVAGLFILDTGASATVLDEKTKEKFQLKVDKSVHEGVGAGASNLKTSLSNNNELAFGTLKVKDIPLVVMDLSHVNKAMEQREEEQVDGVIGADILLAFNGIIDYEKLNLFLQKD